MIRAAMAAAATRAGSPSDVPEFVIAGILALLGVRSLVHWMRLEFRATSPSEHVLFALHVTARVGTWLALGLAFVGYALVAEPQRFRWFLVVILVLAAIQLLTAASLGLGARPRARGLAVPPRGWTGRPSMLHHLRQHGRGTARTGEDHGRAAGGGRSTSEDPVLRGPHAGGPGPSGSDR